MSPVSIPPLLAILLVLCSCDSKSNQIQYSKDQLFQGDTKALKAHLGMQNMAYKFSIDLEERHWCSMGYQIWKNGDLVLDRPWNGGSNGVTSQHGQLSVIANTERQDGKVHLSVAATRKDGNMHMPMVVDVPAGLRATWISSTDYVPHGRKTTVQSGESFLLGAIVGHSDSPAITCTNSGQEYITDNAKVTPTRGGMRILFRSEAPRCLLSRGVPCYTACGNRANLTSLRPTSPIDD